MTTVNGYEIFNQDNLTDSTTQEFITDSYDQWAKDYDKDTADKGYVGPSTCAECLDEELKKCFADQRFGLRILDAGAGTGFVGQNLKDLGYTNIDALDISQEMLNIARDKCIYRKLICAAICDQRIDEINDNEYDAAISSGAITAGHVKPCGLKEILRHVKPGGLICFSRDLDNQESVGYRNMMDKLIQEKQWEQVVKKVKTFHTVEMQEHPDLAECFLFVFKVLKK